MTGTHGMKPTPVPEAWGTSVSLSFAQRAAAAWAGICVELRKRVARPAHSTSVRKGLTAVMIHSGDFTACVEAIGWAIRSAAP
jgi:hypothetical protein